MSTEGSSSAASSSLASMRDDEEEDAESKDQFLEEFANKLVNFEDLEHDPCFVKESDLTEIEQLEKLGIERLEMATEFDRTVFIRSCELGFTKALSAIIVRLKRVYSSRYTSAIHDYMSTTKDIDYPEPNEFTVNETLPRDLRIKGEMIYKPATALHFCLATGFFPGLRILVEEAMTEITRPFYLTFCNIDEVINDEGRISKPEMPENETPYLPKGWWSPLVFAVSNNKTKCALFSLQRGAIPYWSNEATRHFAQDFMCTALYTIIAYKNVFLFDQVMGRKFPTSPFPYDPIEMSPVVPRAHRNNRLIAATMSIANEYHPGEHVASRLIDLRIVYLQLENEISAAKGRNPEHDDTYTELPRLRAVRESRMNERLKTLEPLRDEAKRKFDDLSDESKKREAEHRDLYSSMALSMVKRAGPWERWISRKSPAGFVRQTGPFYDLGMPSNLLRLGSDFKVTFYYHQGSAIDYSDAYDLTVHAVNTKMDSVFEFLVYNVVPLFKRNQGPRNQKVYNPDGGWTLLDAVSDRGTSRMAEIMIAEKGMNPFCSDTGNRVYKKVFGEALTKREEDQDADYTKIKNPEYVAPYVRFLLNEASKDESCFYRKNIVDFPSIEEYAETLDPEATLLDLAVMADDRELITAAAALGGDPSDSLFTAVILDYPEAFYTLLGLGATSRESDELAEILEVARAQLRIGEALKKKGIVRIPNLQSMALRALFEQTPAEREGLYHSILEERRQTLVNMERSLEKLQSGKRSPEKLASLEEFQSSRNKHKKETDEIVKLSIQNRINAIRASLEAGPYKKIPAPFLQPPLSPNKPIPVFVPRAPVVAKAKEKQTPEPEEEQTPELKLRTPPFVSVLPEDSSSSSSSPSPSSSSFFSTPQQRDKEKSLLRSAKKAQQARDGPEARRTLFRDTTELSSQERRGTKRESSPLSEPGSSLSSQREQKKQKEPKEELPLFHDTPEPSPQERRGAKRDLSPPYDPDYSASAQEEEKVQRTGKLIRAVFTACKNQDQKSVSAMLEQYPHLIKARLADGTTLSAYASKRGIKINQ